MYKAILYGEVIDTDEDQTDLLRRCTNKLGSEAVMSEDFKIETEAEVSSGQ